MPTLKSKPLRTRIIVAVALAASAAVYVQVMARSQAILDARHASPPSMVVATRTPAAIAEGARLVAVTACTGCHGADLTGGPLNIAATEVLTPNLTIQTKRLSDAQLDQAIRRGLRPDGTTELVMPAQAYARLTDAEMASIIGYLRSLPPKGAAAAKLQPGLLLRTSMVFGGVKTAAEQIALAKPPLFAGAQRETGRHLAAIACGRCHGADLSGNRDAGQDLTVRGYFDRARFHALLCRGEVVGEGKMELMTQTAKASFSHFTSAEIDAIYDYLDARDAILIANARRRAKS